jgi:hypothetical protein
MIEKAIKYLKKRFKEIPIGPTHGGTQFTSNYLIGAIACNRVMLDMSWKFKKGIPPL